MRTIWKFEVPEQDKFTLELPAGAEFLSVQRQFDGTQAWFLLDPEASKATRRFLVVGTGHTITIPETKKLDYLGTFQLYDGRLVFHLFEYDRPIVRKQYDT